MRNIAKGRNDFNKHTKKNILYSIADNLLYTQTNMSRLQNRERKAEDVYFLMSSYVHFCINILGVGICCREHFNYVMYVFARIFCCLVRRIL